MTGTETPLGGGNMSSGVVRSGDTVRRPAGPWTPAVHALLAHLHDAGFNGAPRPLGIEERGREILTFIPGTPAWPDQFHLLDDDAQLRRAARLIRDFHDAVTGFTPPPDARWQALTPADGDEIIAHHDLAPWNLVIGSRQWAFIDWDTAAPGTRLWDLAYAMHGFAPLSAHPSYQRADAGRRLRLIADAYGLTTGARHSSHNLPPQLPEKAQCQPLPGNRVTCRPELWSLTVGDPFQPGGQTAWVAPARDRSGADLVLKVVCPQPEAAHEADGLCVWAGNGTVSLRAAKTFEGAAALLVERCVPGYPLSRYPEPEQDMVIAGLLHRLWITPAEPHPFQPLQVMCQPLSPTRPGRGLLATLAAVEQNDLAGVPPERVGVLMVDFQNQFCHPRACGTGPRMLRHRR
jgi:hypothetical protein